MLTYGLFLHFNSKYSYDSFSLLLLWVLMTFFISVSVSNTGSILQFQKYARGGGKGGGNGGGWGPDLDGEHTTHCTDDAL